MHLGVLRCQTVGTVTDSTAILREDSLPQGHHSLTLLTATLGALLGLGAPVGWLALRAIGTPPAGPHPLEWIGTEILRDPGLYAYLAVGTMAAFGFFGGLTGWMFDRLRQESRDLVQSQHRLMRDAITDSLTGLYNRRFFDLQLREQIVRAQEDDRGFALLFLDIDDFRSVSDEYGTVAAQRVVKSAADVIRNSAGENRWIFRYGGDKYAVLLPGYSRDAAAALKTRIAESVAQEVPTRAAIDLPLSISVGVAMCAARNTTTPSALLADAFHSLSESRLARHRPAPPI